MNFRQFIESVLQAEHGDVQFLQTILDDATDSSSPLVFADYLEERRNPIGPYLRAKAEQKPIPKDTLQFDNYFFQGIRQGMHKPGEPVGNWTPHVDDRNAVRRVTRKYYNTWKPIVEGKYYWIGGTEVRRAAGHDMICYSPEKRLFFKYNYTDPILMWENLKKPTQNLYWLMAMNALLLEGVFNNSKVFEPPWNTYRRNESFDTWKDVPTYEPSDDIKILDAQDIYQQLWAHDKKLMMSLEKDDASYLKNLEGSVVKHGWKTPVQIKKTERGIQVMDGLHRLIVALRLNKPLPVKMLG